MGHMLPMKPSDTVPQEIKPLRPRLTENKVQCYPQPVAAYFKLSLSQQKLGATSQFTNMFSANIICTYWLVWAGLRALLDCAGKDVIRSDM